MLSPEKPINKQTATTNSNTKDALWRMENLIFRIATFLKMSSFQQKSSRQVNKEESMAHTQGKKINKN